ncbi:hypothetical protein RB195_019093 [Necator americanus]|uniref:Uncharacterized protein n=1 Tax=Necator americanus TaxID=51031 RepID=A0ABR1CEU8_NECAM
MPAMSLYASSKHYEASTCCQLCIEAAYELCLRSDKAGVDLLEISNGNRTKRWTDHRLNSSMSSITSDVCWRAKAATRKIFNKDALRLILYLSARRNPCGRPPSLTKSNFESLSAIRPIMMYGWDTCAAPSTVMERLHCTERKLLRRLFGYFWTRVCNNEELYVNRFSVPAYDTCV